MNLQGLKNETGKYAYGFLKKEKIIIGVLPGDGVGPILMEQAMRVLGELVGKEIAEKKIEIRTIEGMDIATRVAKLESLPEDVKPKIKECDVLIKGPMVTPRAGDGLPNLVSANSLLRRELELFAAVRPIKIPDKISTGHSSERISRENISGAIRVYR